MNWDRISGKWTEYKGRVRERWAKLTDDDLARIGGKRDQLLGVLQERYGWVREQAERQIKDFESSADTMTTGDQGMSRSGTERSGTGSERTGGERSGMGGSGMGGGKPGRDIDDEDEESFKQQG